MLIPVKPRSIAILVTLFAMGLMVVSCSKLQDSPAYQAACQGEPLFTIESRNQALEDGYAINHIYNCIDKASFVTENEVRARIAAANTPEGIAKANQEKAERDAEWDKNLAEERAQRAATVESQRVDTSPLSVVLRNVDVNTATESELTSVISVGTKVAAQIIEERNKRRFNDWADLVHRVIGLSAAQTAVYASICGLNVDGKSLDGAPPDATMAASIYQ
jgi:DNA uptake protein ComE-like DNA-binding protein